MASGAFILLFYMPQTGFEPGTYGIRSTKIWDSALDHSASQPPRLDVCDKCVFCSKSKTTHI